MKTLFCTTLILFACAMMGAARDLHVDPTAGDDGNDGISAPLKTIPRAIRLAEPGDTIHLKPVVYHDYAGFYNKRGEADKPITLDGHGAILEGSDPLNPAQWTETSPGLFHSKKLFPKMNDAILTRWFFLMNGKMNLMGRTSKGKRSPLKEVDQLEAGEWTYVKDPTPPDSDSKSYTGAFYIRLSPGQNLEDAKIRAPLRSAGVQFSGDNAHLVIKNVTATHPYNDGFNIHGDCRNIRFENIRAIECGDDGISAHESAEYTVDGLVSIGNSTGICDTGSSKTSYKHVFIADCVGFDLYFLDTGRYSISDAVVLSSAQNPLVTTGRATETEPCRLKLDNVYFQRELDTGSARVAGGSILSARHFTLKNLEITVSGEISYDACLINGTPEPADATQAGARIGELLETLVPEKYKDRIKN